MVAPVERGCPGTSPCRRARETSPGSELAPWKRVPDDGVRPRQLLQERARAKAPADLRNYTGKIQGSPVYCH
jgi:hypothetical protein